MRRIIIFLQVLFFASSCQKVNDFYTDKNHSDVENVRLTELRGVELSFSAIRVGQKLVIMSYVKLVDEKVHLQHLNIKLLDSELQTTKRTELFTDTGQRISFKNFNEVKHYFNDDTYMKSVPIHYIFEGKKIEEIDDLNFEVTLTVDSNTVYKCMQMERNSRYRTFLEGG